MVAAVHQHDLAGLGDAADVLADAGRDAAVLHLVADHQHVEFRAIQRLDEPVRQRVAEGLAVLEVDARILVGHVGDAPADDLDVGVGGDFIASDDVRVVHAVVPQRPQQQVAAPVVAHQADGREGRGLQRRDVVCHVAGAAGIVALRDHRDREMGRFAGQLAQTHVPKDVQIQAKVADHGHPRL